jgi:hypothetical protein
MGAVVSLPLDLLMLDVDIQPRDTMSKTLIQEYAELYRDGHPLPPITVVQEGQKHWVADGFHRERAARQAGLSEIQANVEAGTKRDAMLYSCGANKHGKARTPGDKRRAVARLLRDPEWRGWSNVEIARHCGVAQSFVAKLRRSLCSEQSDDQQRTYRTKHGTMATMHTGRIGRAGGASAAEEPGRSPAPSTLAADVVRHDGPNASVPAPEQVVTNGALSPNHDTNVVNTEENPRTMIEAIFPSIAEPAAELVGSSLSSQTLAPQHSPSDVLALMGDLCMALRQFHDGASATVGHGWSPGLVRVYLQTCAELIGQLYALQRAVAPHCLGMDAGGLIDPAGSLMPSPVADDASPVSRDAVERERPAPADGSGPDRHERDGQQAVWERVKAFEAEGLDDVQIVVRLNVEEGRRRWNRGSLRALRRAYA